MPRTLTAQDRSLLIRLASGLPVGSLQRKNILAGLRLASDEILVSGGDREDWEDRVFEMVVTTYQKIGVPVNQPRDLMEFDRWYLYLNTKDQPVAFTLTKTTTFGIKAGLAGSNGSSEGKRIAIANLRSNFFKSGHYGEVSHAVEGIATAAGAPVVCNAYAPKILGKPVEPHEDGIHYTRNISGVGTVQKVLVGKPKGIPTTDYNNPSCPVEGKQAALQIQGVKQATSPFEDRCAHALSLWVRGQK
jgi:hypothetical protein